MITLIGPNWRSKLALQERLTQFPGNLRVCWGASNIPNALNGGDRLDGLEQLQAFTSTGIECPSATEDISTAINWVRGGDLVFGRKFIHTKGRDIVGPTHKSWKRRDYWVKVVDAITQEWRIHVLKGRSIARGLKVQVDVPWRLMPVRNRNNGWHMTHEEEPPKGLRPLASQAVAACGYNFGAVDLYITEDGTMGVFEVNKAPGLDNYTLEAYAQGFAAIAAGTFREK